uniref:Uncharacterized protein n=1 Tax=Anguilla anguilla TaxID=7936 RepID=A0A0E9UJ99_ANGAN
MSVQEMCPQTRRLILNSRSEKFTTAPPCGQVD